MINHIQVLSMYATYVYLNENKNVIHTVVVLLFMLFFGTFRIIYSHITIK